VVTVEMSNKDFVNSITFDLGAETVDLNLGSLAAIEEEGGVGGGKDEG
jgi:hypothetical protein